MLAVLSAPHLHKGLAKHIHVAVAGDDGQAQAPQVGEKLLPDLYRCGTGAATG